MGGKDPDLEHVESDRVPEDTSSDSSNSSSSSSGSSSDDTSTDDGDINMSLPDYSGNDPGDSFELP